MGQTNNSCQGYIYTSTPSGPDPEGFVRMSYYLRKKMIRLGLVLKRPMTAEEIEKEKRQASEMALGLITYLKDSIARQKAKVA